MADSPNVVPGAIVWTDLTVPDATAIRDFYAAVARWQPEPVSMGDYADYNMNTPGGEAAAGDGTLATGPQGPVTGGE